MILIICFVFSIILNVALCTGIIIAARKVELYEDFVEIVQRRLTSIVTTMREIDLRGSFEADDEVGIVFQGMLGLVNQLDDFIEQD